LLEPAFRIASPKAAVEPTRFALYVCQEGEITMSPIEVVEANYEAYNARDADRLAGLYAENCVVTDLNGT
jgi:hypothetical protein